MGCFLRPLPYLELGLSVLIDAAESVELADEESEEELCSSDSDMAIGLGLGLGADVPLTLCRKRPDIAVLWWSRVALRCHYSCYYCWRSEAHSFAAGSVRLCTSRVILCFLARARCCFLLCYLGKVKDVHPSTDGLWRIRRIQVAWDTTD